MLSECSDLISALGSQTCELYLSLYNICMAYLLFRISFLVFAFAVHVAVVVVVVAQPRG